MKIMIVTVTKNHLTVINMSDKEFLAFLENAMFTSEFHYRGGYDEYDFDYSGDNEEIKNLIAKIEFNKNLIYQLNSLISDLVGNYEEIEQEGGEGEGNSYHFVLYFKDYDKYIRSDGFYSSYEGVIELSEWYIVTPKEKTIIVYE